MNDNLQNDERNMWIPRNNLNMLSINEITKILPYRYPFLHIDKILDYVPGEWALGLKCISINEAYFGGHFPGRPIMPGMILMEAMAQTGVFVILTNPENKGKLVLLASIRNALFKKKVKPGDVVKLSHKLINQEGTIVTGKAIAQVDGKVCASAELLFAITE